MENFLNYVTDYLQNFLRILRSINFFDVLDIIILTFLVYYLIKLMRETRAMQLLKGIGFLVIIFILVQIFQLKAMSFIIENFLQVGIIAIMIVFQPELRRILEKVGQTRVSTLTMSIEKSISGESPRDKAIIGIADGCEALHNSKTGALIVIELSTKLGDIIEKETSCIINADCEAELFCNIFYKGAPFHDGAVIIRNNRIYAARCFLPNTQKDQYISSELGSRHRAAAGMSENSDALVVVVSEETGAISIAKDGQITRDINRNSLINILNAYMPGAPTDKRKKRSGKGRKEEQS